MVSSLSQKILLGVAILLLWGHAIADTPVSLFQSYAGHINFVGTEATRRTQPNTGDACAVLPNTTTNTANITGIPAGATILAAHLYWAGSYSTQSGSTRTTPDYWVRFEGTGISADSNRRYTANYTVGPYNLDFFSGVADVTALVRARANPNGSYSFRGLSVNTAGQHCDSQSVLAGWSLAIIYSDPSEDYRVVNIFEGFQRFRGESITLTPTNFVIPAAPVNGKIAHITWEGDVGNSSPLNGFSERLTFNGVTLSDGDNPANNQFNSVSSVLSALPSTGSTDTSSYGIDFDVYSVTSLLSAGQTSATTTYSSGGDLVLLSSEIISVTNTPVADLSITKSHSGNFIIGQQGSYQIQVSNDGPSNEPGPIVVTDNLPAGLGFISATGTGWSCTASAQLVTCTHAAGLAVGASTAPISLSVSVAAAASPSVINSASVSGTNFDNVSGNNTANDNTVVESAPIISLQKTSKVWSDPVNGSNSPKAIPGALVEYTLKASNSGSRAADNNSIVLSDAIPANTALYVNDISGAGTGPVRFVDGSPASGLSYNFISLSSNADHLSFSSTDNNPGSFTYTPTPDATGVDSNVKYIKIKTQGQFQPASGSGTPSFQIKFRVKVQ